MSEDRPSTIERPASTGLDRRELLVAGAAAAVTAALPRTALAQPAGAGSGTQVAFKRIPTQYIAALSAPEATSGDDAQLWGLWRIDPGPRGVRLDRYERLKAAGGLAPAQWQFDGDDWWLEEHGLIMEQPEFPLPPGRYMVTGARTVTTVLTVHPQGQDGAQRWELADGATVHDVTHLRCRSARYTPARDDDACTPANAPADEFPVSPGAAMPPVESCRKQDYAVLIVIGMAADSA